MSLEGFTWRAGGCHCGGVRFEVALPEVAEAQTCNCSMCAKSGFIHIIVPESRFRVTKGMERLAEYTFNSRVARHLFCAECGIKSFYRPRSNPDGWSVNARCLDEAAQLDLSAFDGQNWEANADQLAHLSLEPS
ncbi:GFA family protein [Phenylobacterium aquaticum]|uniref:GFA family protein n=1 Tax=Phenylobacterium aquaticum TaxID=1763816 RepID=UPI0026EB255E|nr:GFA family protein [Phenylobacterium aquaticum]